MPARKAHRLHIRRMLREVAEHGLDAEDIADLEDHYTDDLAPDEPGDGRIVRKRIEDNE